ncbi:MULTISPECIES: MerR family transcriptional regulator [Bacillus]|uniref:MerR family transcriptional regulator n=1 Tax=Bacillus TaxID=1386 RepID=UPI000E724DEC|nr:MerR family transcriptional regulator [Bacillus safensis]MBU8606447.1 MerR family transcriptional regulator [Bacillus safensis]MBU8617970.1 MerR family transcriptional regulator [Bacillus safensis]MBU8629098.1 MerR family transcriptional regulator [Bacillus safensis]MCY1094186.1 MerR family transcriptional regulator [Bacillus safensis]MCY1097919.1 MerR family transcriptional regulator [Bacillus safensis]
MFKIGDFSMLSKVPVKTLRYYDQIDLLKPKQIDQESGYRYYSAEQLLEVNRIFLYKELGFTLKQMGQLLREDISVEQIQGMFLLKESEIQQLIEREQQKLARIKERMHLIKREGCVEKEQEVIIKSVESKRFMSFQSNGTVDEIPSFFQTFHHLLHPQELNSEPQIVLWRESIAKESEFEFEVGYSAKAIRGSLPKSITIRTLPAEETMATLLFHSDSPFAQTACVDLATWIEHNGYRMKEDQPGREIYYPLAENGEGRLIEIQIPIKNEVKS